jgi:hypothetical protein
LPQPGQRLRQRAGQHDVPDRLGPGQPLHAADLGELGVDAADAGERVQVERDGGAQRDQDDLRQLADPEPHDEHRDQSEQGQHPDDLQQRVDGVLAEPAQPGDQGKQDGDAAADGETDRHPLQRDQHRVLQRAVGGGVARDQADGGVPDSGRRRQLVRRDQPG